MGKLIPGWKGLVWLEISYMYGAVEFNAVNGNDDDELPHHEEAYVSQHWFHSHAKESFK